MHSFAIIFLLAGFFLVAERIFPGRALPHASGWYARAAFLNGAQLGVVLLAGFTWNRWFEGASLSALGATLPPVATGLLAWFIGTFVFYWWHLARHRVSWIWRFFHQIHHSPARIETLTAFYKHPVEIAFNSVIAATLVFLVLGGSFEAAGWYNVFAAGGEMFYHSNLRTPHWCGWFIQRPEHHSIHHQLDVHDFNYGDITWWDRLFGTFKDTNTFALRCGFPNAGESHLTAMLVGNDVYHAEV